MSIDLPDEMGSKVCPTTPESTFLGRLRATARIAVVAGAGGSVALTVYAGRHNDSRLLVALFVIWVLSPFMALLLASLVSRRWPVLTQTTLYIAMLVVTVGSLAIYGAQAFRLPRPQAAFVFVVVPPASWLLIAVVVPIAGLMSRKLSPRIDGA
jgi:hypothetical protein